jgi:hypothetical protein
MGVDVQIIHSEEAFPVFNEAVFGADGDDVLETDVGSVVLQQHQRFLAFVLADYYRVVIVSAAVRVRDAVEGKT